MSLIRIKLFEIFFKHYFDKCYIRCDEQHTKGNCYFSYVAPVELLKENPITLAKTFAKEIAKEAEGYNLASHSHELVKLRKGSIVSKTKNGVHYRIDVGEIELRQGKFLRVDIGYRGISYI